MASFGRNLAPYDFAVAIDAKELKSADPMQVATIELRSSVAKKPASLFNDNSRPDKDIGNMVRNERAGGFNQATEDAWGLGEGGVFVEALLTFSPGYLPDDQKADQPGATTKFDTYFKPIAPALGGTAIETFPGGTNDEETTKAINVLSALVASSSTTIAGYLVGLPAGVPDNMFHNIGNNGCFMDDKEHRRFEERAKLDFDRGQGVIHFSRSR